jgi:hypothetical protein
MSASIQFRDMRAADAGFIELVYRELLEPSFSPDELDPLDVILDGLCGSRRLRTTYGGG